MQWIARIKNGLKLRPTTRFRTYSNQIISGHKSHKYKTDSDQIRKVSKKVTFEVVYGEIMTGASGSMRPVSY